MQFINIIFNVYYFIKQNVTFFFIYIDEFIHLCYKYNNYY